MEAKVTQLPWSDELEERLKSPAIATVLPFLRAEVQRGIAQLWRFEDGKDEAFAITRTDLNPKEFVVCYFTGSGLRKFGAILIEAARSKRTPIRFHTASAAVARLARPLGARVDEYVLRVA